ncbi:MAG: class I SAM-dependent methyltransferase [Bdellovibrionales bacterium]|nr:class I SAM-dependent methyltransferase [Bdellovibrionales bacterium]
MSKLCTWIDKRLYPQYGDYWDQQLFRAEVVKRLHPSHVLLDFGAGRGANRNMNFRGQAAKVCGVDVDPIVHENPFLDEAKELVDGSIPYPDQTFDVVVSSDVLEHLEDPVATFREIRRVLKPGGWFLSKTPNAWHYVPLISRCTPHWFHEWVNKKRGREANDTFPTFYRANTKRALRALAAEAGFSSVETDMFEGRPEYLRFSVPSYAIGAIYQRMVTSCAFLASLRVVVISRFQAPQSVHREAAVHSS